MAMYATDKSQKGTRKKWHKRNNRAKRHRKGK